MALSAKSETLKHVPWFSLTEWYQTYEQIYSNDTLQQSKAKETLLIWKARVPKLPIGVECTLSIIQVCLRDREWTPKIDKGELSMSYENDLCLMYSTMIMRFLNQISNVGHTKQTSMFQIAKQLKIPEWIVNLRHDAAHGHELPSISALRLAANILLTWLHEEYWAAEAKAIEKRFEKTEENPDNETDCESQNFVGFFELWTAVGLYKKANYETVRDLPDAKLRDTLLNFCTISRDIPSPSGKSPADSRSDEKETNYLLTTAQNMLFTELSSFISKNKPIPNIEDTTMRMLFDSEAFLPGPDIMGIFMAAGDETAYADMDSLPPGMIQFWQNFIGLLHDKKLLEELICRLYEFVDSSHEAANKRFVASLWLQAISESFLKLRIIQSTTQTLEQSSNDGKKRTSAKQMMQQVRQIVDAKHPEFRHAIWLNAAVDVPAFLEDSRFADDLLLGANPFTKHFIRPTLELVTPPISPASKEHFLKLVKIHTNDEPERKSRQRPREKAEIYGLEDVVKLFNEYGSEFPEENGISDKILVSQIADQTIRNDCWELASSEYEWAACPFGVLPWQLNSLEMLEPTAELKLRPTSIREDSRIVPGLLDEKLLTTEGRVNWDNVLRKKKRLKRKRHYAVESDVMVGKAIQVVKKQKK